MLAVDAVPRQFRPMLVPDKTRLNLVLHVGQVGIDGQIIAACCGPDGFGALGLGAKRPQHAHLLDDPDEGRLPIDGFGNALEGFVGGNMVGTFFASHPGDRIGEEGVAPKHLEGDIVFHTILLTTCREARDGTPAASPPPSHHNKNSL